MVNYYKYAAGFLLIWRLIDLFYDVNSASSHKQNKNIDLICKEPINKVKQEIVELEEKIERVDLVLKNLE